jgi:phenylalanyl-tRNA synthetase alpha chain
MQFHEFSQVFSSILIDALNQIEGSTSLDHLEGLRVFFLGKKGKISQFLKDLSTVDPAERRAWGELVHQGKHQFEQVMQEKHTKLKELQLAQELKTQTIDTSLPSRLAHRGSLHLVTQTAERVIQIFRRLGFDLMLGTEVESEYFNFEAVNIPKDHPARDMQDTFFLQPEVVLRTHTSGIQVRAMQSERWPIRILSPGAVYRCDSDATHVPMFHQVEGLWLDEGIRMSDLKGVLRFFIGELFGSSTKMRLRPSYFPFVEPGAEVDMGCFQCQGKSDACRICQGTGWIEILGAGMVHPSLFQKAKYPDSVTGFAFGMGIERIAMLLHRIPDLRLLFQNDANFLRQF